MKHSGFTLVELLVATAIFSLVIAMALPSLSTNIKNHRLQANATDIYRLLVLARSQAINLNRVTTLCPSSDQQSCLKSRDWSGKHILLYVDNNFDGQRDSGEELIKISKLPEKQLVHYRALQNKSYLQFLPSGITNYQNGHFSICSDDKNQESAIIIIINRSGRGYYGQDNNNDGIVENGSGNNVVCEFS